MRLNQAAIVALLAPSLLLLVAVIFATTAQSLAFEESIDESNEQDENRNARFANELLKLQSEVTFRSLKDDDDDPTCANECDNDIIRDFRASMEMDVDVQVEQEEVGEGDSGRGFIGIFRKLFDGNQSILGRLMNGLFKIFNRSNEDDPKFMFPTDKILPLLSNYSSKVNSLAAMIRRESVTDSASSRTPDTFRMMYNISAENMEAVAAVLDPIMDSMRQQKTMDVRAIGCHMNQILMLLRDVTVPTIESVSKLIYMNSNNAEMKERLNQYSQSGKSDVSSTNALTTSATNTAETTCVVPDAASRTASMSRIFFDDLFSFLFTSSIDIGPIGHVVSIILLIILFPLSIVVSVIGIIVLIFYLISKSITGNPDNDDGLEGFVTAIIFILAIGAPFLLIRQIFENIKGFFEDILDPFLPDRPTFPPVVFTPFPTFFPTPAPANPKSVPALVKAPVSPDNPIDLPGSGRDTLASDVTYRLSVALESPFNTVLNALTNENNFSGTSTEDEEALDCEMAALKCKSVALTDGLPF